MKGRSTRKAPAASQKDDSIEGTAPVLAPTSTNPPLLFILPKDRSTDSRIVTLPNPANSGQNRYFYDPSLGLYEFTRISSPKKDPTSWLISSTSNSTADDTCEESPNLRNGYVLEDSGIFVATPVDPIFFIFPSLLADLGDSGKQLFVTLDDHLDKAAGQSEVLQEILSSAVVIGKLDISMSLICDKVEAGDDSMYRVNAVKLSKVLLSKAEKVVAAGLPPSMEEKFVKEALQAPALRSQKEIVAELEKESQQEAEADTTSAEQSQSTTSVTTANDSQDSLASSGTTSTAATSIDSAPLQDPIDSDVRRLLRLRTAFNFILSSYLKPVYHEKLRALILGSDSSIDFSPLDKRLDEIAALKKEAQALRSLSENVGRKRGFEEDDEAAEARAEKKRKKEEEEAKKKSQSRAIKQLAKTDTSGMKKLSSFFTKPAAKKAAG
ncbi:Hypothetical protein D9617_15g043550 [Elsinoe fawcettii]|nr:Hypothetical protein D9617_15g043550 [Elsinoe fawcettii]